MILINRSVVGRIEFRSGVPLVGRDTTGDNRARRLRLAGKLKDVQAPVDIESNHLLRVARVSGERSKVHDAVVGLPLQRLPQAGAIGQIRLNVFEIALGFASAQAGDPIPSLL